jgi:acetolactate synthase regulatory subunit
MHQQLNEELLGGDLRMLVDNIFEIDSYASKMGSDKDIVVVSFTVESQKPADDLVNFCERGYDFVLDADSTPGELNDGKYKVFVEIERNKRIPEQIIELLDGVGKLSEVDNFK